MKNLKYKDLLEINGGNSDLILPTAEIRWLPNPLTPIEPWDWEDYWNNRPLHLS